MIFGLSGTPASAQEHKAGRSSLSYKEQGLFVHDSQMLLFSLDQSSFKIDGDRWKTVLWSDKLKIWVLFFFNRWCCVLWRKEERGHQACYQRSVQKAVFLMLWGALVPMWLATCSFRETSLKLKGVYRWCLYRGRENENAKLQFAPITTAWVHSRRVLSAVQTFPSRKCLTYCQMQNTTKKTRDCWAARILNNTRMGQRSSTKGPATDFFRLMFSESLCERILVYEIFKLLHSESQLFQIWGCKSKSTEGRLLRPLPYYVTMLGRRGIFSWLQFLQLDLAML